jgi:ribose transport system permease protein
MTPETGTKVETTAAGPDTTDNEPVRTTAAARPNRLRRVVAQLIRLPNIVGAQNLGLLVALLAIVVTFSRLNENYLTWRSLELIVVSVTIVGLLAVMETVAIIIGGIDISVGSQVGMCAVVTAMVFAGTGDGVSGGNALIAMCAGLGTGAAMGLLNGSIIVYGRVNPIIATLAMLVAYKGFAQVISSGESQGFVSGDDVFASIGSKPGARWETVLGLPVMIWIFGLVALAVHVMLKYTDMGRNIYAIGGNATAARLAGINLNRYVISVYVAVGAVAGLAGIVLMSRTGQGHPTGGSEGLELRAITAAFLGGVAMRGGKGGVGGAVLAVLLIGALNIGLSIEGVQIFWQNLATGLLLVLAVIIQNRRTGERAVGLPD